MAPAQGVHQARQSCSGYMPREPDRREPVARKHPLGRTVRPSSVTASAGGWRARINPRSTWEPMTATGTGHTVIDVRPAASGGEAGEV